MTLKPNALQAKKPLAATMPPYFAPLLAWQVSAWQMITGQYMEGKLPHGLLAAGMAGIGKRAFVYRLVAWLLCENKLSEGNPTMGACGVCQSCRLLKDSEGHTHPDIQSLPKPGERVIKIDDVRRLQDFFNATHKGVRLVIFDNSEAMTTGASNALLKTLEEPNAGIYLILISDTPTRLLPTIKSRVQTLPLGNIDHTLSYNYVKDNTQGYDPALLLTLADFAPLAAAALPDKPWFAHRQSWLSTFIALQLSKRTAVQASDYWQGVLSVGEFMTLTRLMVIELWRLGLGFTPTHTDVKADTLTLIQTLGLNERYLTGFGQLLDEIAQALAQNVQDKLAYDRLLTYMATPSFAKWQTPPQWHKTQTTATSPAP